MKKFSVIAVIILLSGMFFTACEKNNETVVTNDPVLERILDFKADVENPSLKSGVEIDVEDAVWLVEAALNYTYCITLEEEEYIDASIKRGTYSIELQDIENRFSYWDVVQTYIKLANYLTTYNDELGVYWSKYYMIDIEFIDNKFECNFIIHYKNMNKSKPIWFLENLNYDWHTGAGNCDWGRCDWSHEENNAQLVLSETLTLTQGLPGPNIYLTNITPAFQSWPWNDPYNIQSGLYSAKVVEPFPCVTSVEMHDLYNYAKNVNLNYEPPTGWAKSYTVYEIKYNTTSYPGYYWYYSYYDLRIGKINYSGGGIE